MNIDPSLEGILIETELLDSLPGNPRRGNIDAIKASYEKFGQVKPIIAVANEDRYTVIAGNHQLAAVKELGWTHMAVVVKDWDHDKAVAFALADNRTSELGHTDESAQFEMMKDIIDYEDELWVNLGWDDFEMALMEGQYLEDQIETQDFSGGYVPPVIVEPPSKPAPPPLEKGEDEEYEYHADEKTDKDIITHGADAVGQAGAKTVVQYTLVFDNVEQQKKWYTFLRKIKEDSTYDGLSTAGQVILYIERHSDGLFDEP